MTLTNLGKITGNAVETFGNRTVTTAEPNDIFKFEIENARSINLLLTDLNGDADLKLFRDNGNGTLQMSGSNRDQLISTSENGGSLDDHINRWSRPGTYFAVVEQYSSTSSISYDLYVAASKNSGRTGPPNTLAQENDLGNLFSDQTFNNESVGFRKTSGGNGFGLNETGDTSDLYYFTLPAGRTVNITLSGLSNNADIRLIDDDGVLGRRVYPGEVVAESTNGGTTPDTISWSTPGDYYLQVYPYDKVNDIEYDIKFDV